MNPRSVALPPLPVRRGEGRGEGSIGRDGAYENRASSVTPGQSAPIGATVVDAGVNFSLFSRNATGVDLLFFDREDDARPARIIHLDPATNRTYHYWHAFVDAVQPGQLYSYRVHGPF